MPEINKLDSKEISEEPEYWFIGGLRYGKGKIDLETESEINFPYTTYYTDKVLSFTKNGTRYIPLSEIKLPLIVLQYKDRCLAAQIEPVIDTEEGPAHHFIGMTDRGLEIVVPEKFRRKTKDAEWLGKGKKKTQRNPDVKEYSLNFKQFDNWQEAVETELDRKIESPNIEDEEINKAFEDAQNWLFRAWDDELGVFLQLPWRKRPGFALDEYSYGLTSCEASRLDYFDEMSNVHEEFSYWSERLKNVFKDDNMQKRDLKHGEGMAWYNTIYFNGKEIEGRFYLGTGYCGYPGGQSSISAHLLNYLERKDDRELENLVKENLQYILSTQKDSGAWPAALKNERELPLKKKDYYGKVSEGATGESVKVLLKAWSYFGDEKYRKSAERGLEYLSEEYPVCRNGLRDIGTDEIEAFSAFAVIEAFLEASKVLNDDKWLEDADTYCSYLESWMLTYSGEPDLKGVCHPISETITQRISPFETIKTAKILLKASEVLEKELTNKIGLKALEKGLETINNTGGMSEGVFYFFGEENKSLETEQSFATSELLHTIYRFSDSIGKTEKKTDKKEESSLKLEKNRIVSNNSTAFDLEKFGFAKIREDTISQELMFKGPYSRRSRLRSKILSKMRKINYSVALKDVKSLWKGIKPKDISYSSKSFSDVDKTIETSIEDGRCVFSIDADIYIIEGEARINEENFFEVEFEISTSIHDLICEKVVIETNKDKESDPQEDNRINLENSELTEEGFDISRKGNWTHGGLYRGKIVADN